MDKLDTMHMELDQVSDMLTRLISQDQEVARAAQVEIDQYLADRDGRQTKGSGRGSEAAGCRVTSDRTLVCQGTPREKGRILSEECKALGNAAFNQGNWGQAKEYYTSAILQDGSNPVLFTNRALVQLRLGEHLAAQRDCEAAIRLDPDSLKAHVLLAKALLGLDQGQAALKVLELAETLPSAASNAKAIAKCREDILGVLNQLKQDK